ncbi:MAG: class I SAM-dependent methyltransferase [Brumimicrobium sp.]|nr:class I SAM-dependent methyltransferase [Brumimicrobium sp.]
MLKILGEYINYKLKAKGRHGIHSPFVYEFVDECLTQKIPADVSEAFKRYSHIFLKDNSRIRITDYGAGSRKLGDLRKVSDIARISGTRQKTGYLLYRIARHYKPKKILELGTSLGIGTFMLKAGSPDSALTTVDGCGETSSVAKKYFSKTNFTNVSFENTTFSDYLRTNQNEIFDLVFIDGDHRGDKLFELLEGLDKITHPHTIFILDDIRWSSDMLSAWKKLKKDKRYHLTMDLFKIGVIMKNPTKEKEHFVLRYF